MATTKIWPTKGHLASVLKYIVNEQKTDAKTYVSGLNCFPDTAASEMNAVKKHFGKTGGRVAYHAYQSFAPGEATPDQAHQIGVQLANELWGERFQVVIATHLDRGHLHNHFVLNSVSFGDGKRFHSDAAFLYRMRDVSDRLCREYGLSVIEHPQQGATRHHGEIAAEKRGVPTWRSLIQSDIDHAIAVSQTEQQFFHALKAMGYAYKTGQDLSVRPPGKERFFRLKRNLGEQYSMSEIRKRLGRSLPAKKQTVTTVPRKHYRLRGTLPKRKKPHLRRLYLYYCYRLGIFPKHPQSSRKMHFLLREDLRHLDNYTQEIRLLHTYHLDTDVQLSAFLERREGEIKVLTRQRNRLYAQCCRETEPKKAAEIQLEIDRLTSDMKPLRKEVRLCKQIQTRSIHMTKTLEKIQTTQQDKEVQPHGYQRTGR